MNLYSEICTAWLHLNANAEMSQILCESCQNTIFFMERLKMNITCPNSKVTNERWQQAFACDFQTQQLQTPPVCVESNILKFKSNRSI